MTRLILVEIGPREAWIRGLGHDVHGALARAGTPRRYDVAKRATAIPLGSLDEVVAELEAVRGATVQIKSVLL